MENGSMRKKNNIMFLKKCISIVLILVLGILSGCSKNTTQTGNEDKKVQNETEQKKEENQQINNDQKADKVVEVTAKPENLEDTKEKVEEVLYPINLGEFSSKDIELLNDNFEGEITSFTGRGSATAQIVDTVAYGDGHSLYISGRTAYWNGATVDLTEKLVANKRYHVSAMLYYEEGPNSVVMNCKVEKNSSSYLDFATVKLVKGEWTLIEGDITLSGDIKTASVYFETANELGDYINFYVDDMVVLERAFEAVRGVIPSLKEVYKDKYKVGVAVTANELSEERKKLILEQFNSITCGNEMKPDSLLDYEACISDPKYDECPAISFSRATPILDFAYENGLSLRGHTLVWHSQTPRWFFTEGYSKSANAPFVSKELMYRRMENYIRQVITYMQDNYPGMVYAWDVVNEAINSDGAPDGYRSKDSYWYQVCGEEFIEKAFEYARKYAEDGVKLFYNDYNEYDGSKRRYIIKMLKGLVEKGLVDGMGMQEHIGISSPSIIDIQTSIADYAALGLEIQITELDMDMETKTEEDYMKQAQRYKLLFYYYNMLEEQGKADITNVTFWGLSDDISWLSDANGKSYPLLFNEFLLPKLAFYGVLQSSEISLY